MKQETNIRKFSLFPKTIGKSCEATLKPIYHKYGFAEHRIITDWEVIVGSQYARFTLPLKLVTSRSAEKTATLHILVASGRALEFQHIQPVIMDKIATYFGYKAVTKIVMKQSITQIFRKKKQDPLQTIPSPTHTILEIAKQCEDESLQAALIRLGCFVRP